MAEEKATMELTRNPVDGTWGFICLEHGVRRHGMAEIHARNVEAKHIREDHPDPLVITLDLKAAAVELLASYQMARSSSNQLQAMSALTQAEQMWAALTGLTGQEAVDLADTLVATDGPVTATVVPF